MNKALLLACTVILAALALAPAAARAGDGKEELLPAIIVIGERHQPRVLLMLQRAPIGYRLPALEHDSLADVAASVDEIDQD